jgi:microcystin degradation protein MlrC
MSKTYRVALGSIIIECNHLGGTPADLDHFRRTELHYGRDLLQQKSGVIGGVLSVCRERRAEVLPLLAASACPSGPMTSVCYRHLKTELLNRLARSMPIDGVLLPLHGAAAAEDVDDSEGDLLTAVRELVGPGVPIVVTLDLHADVTEPMIRCADAIFGWETYPHRDTFETGVRGAKMLFDILDGRCRPAMAMAKTPVMVSAIHGNTEGEGPFADVMRFAKSLEGRDGVVSTSAFLVHPYLDMADMGGGGLVITNGDLPKARTLAAEIAEMYWARRFELEPELYSPSDAIARGLQIEGGPVLLVETADCCGGGASGDSVATLRALLDSGVDQPSFAPVVDPEAASRCHQIGVGGELVCELGHKIDPKWGKPLPVRGKIVTLSDGRFVYGDGGVWACQEGNMGPTAVVEMDAMRILVMSRPSYDWLDEQFRCVGLAPRAAKFIVAKNPMNYQMAYAGISKGAFVLDTPGPTPPTMRHYAYKKRQRPYFPADQDIPGWTPTVFAREMTR